MTAHVQQRPGEPRVRPDWSQAKCAMWPKPNLWYTDDPKDQKVAQSICAECPIQVDCLRYAFNLRLEHGIWGGTTPKKRAYMRRKGSRV